MKMLLAGRFPSKPFENEVTTSEGWKSVDFLGFISRSEIADVLNRSKIGLVTLHPTPSYVEALPVKFLNIWPQVFPLSLQILVGSKKS